MKNRWHIIPHVYDQIIVEATTLTIGFQSSLQQRSVDVFLEDGTYLHATLANLSQQKSRDPAKRQFVPLSAFSTACQGTSISEII